MAHSSTPRDASRGKAREFCSGLDRRRPAPACCSRRGGECCVHVPRRILRDHPGRETTAQGSRCRGSAKPIEGRSLPAWSRHIAEAAIALIPRPEFYIEPGSVPELGEEEIDAAAKYLTS